MYDKRRDGRYIPKGNSVAREIEAIRYSDTDNRFNLEYDVEVYYDINLLKRLKNILSKVKKAS